MAFRAATQHALNMRLIMNTTRQPIAITSVRPQSTLSTGEVVSDPQIGDYPNLPRISAQTRGPFGWDDPQDKRNFGEPVRFNSCMIRRMHGLNTIQYVDSRRR